MFIIIIPISIFLLEDNKFYIGFTGMGKLMATALLVINENFSLPVLVVGNNVRFGFPKIMLYCHFCNLNFIDIQFVLFHSLHNQRSIAQNESNENDSLSCFVH